MYILINRIVVSVSVGEKNNFFNNDGTLYVKMNYPSLDFTGLFNFLNSIWTIDSTWSINNLTTSDLIYQCFLKSIFLKINRVYSMTNSGIYHNHWIGFENMFSDQFYSNIWLSCLMRLLNNKFFLFMLWGIILFLLQYIAHNFFINFLLNSISSLINKLYNIFVRIFMGNVNRLSIRAVASKLSASTVHSLIFGVGGFFYCVFGYIFDKYKHRIVHNNRFFFNNKYISHNIVGLFYAININVGVFSTNSFWYLTNKVDRAPFYILTTLLTILFAFIWRVLGTIQDTSHVLRSFSEFLTFTCISWSTYALWNFWLGYSSFPDLYGAIFGFIFHLFFSLFAIANEMSSTPNPQWYGVLYTLSFTGAAFSTNGLYGLITTNYTSYWISLFITIVGFVLTVVFHPNVYRELQSSDRNFYVLVIVYAMAYYILLFSFISSTGLLYQLILDNIPGS